MTLTAALDTLDNQMPTTLVVPEHPTAVAVHGEAANAMIAGYGMPLDPWQSTSVSSFMRTDPQTGRWCSTTWGLSVSRQNGKNGALEAIELYMLAVLGLKILHTAHLLSSARKAFKRLRRYFGEKPNDPTALFPELNAMVKEIRKANGQEAIELTNGGLIELSARTSGAGRGTSFDVLVVDEAQEYEEDEQEALEPTISASPSGQPIVIYLGTPPKTIGLRGEPFVSVRNKALTGVSRSTTWIEFSAPGELDDMTEAELIAFVANRENWVLANPAAPHRVTLETIEDEWGRWSPRSFARERLNMWPKPSTTGAHPIDEISWGAQKFEGDTSSWPLAAVGLDMNPERTKVTITMAYWAPGDRIHVEIAADAPYDDAGESSLVNWLWTRCKLRVPIVIDAFSPARSIAPVLKKKRMKIFILNSAEWADASMGFHDAVKDGTLTHFDQIQLNLSVLGATKKPMGLAGAWGFTRDSLDTDLGPIVSATCARFGAAKFGRRPRSISSGESKAPQHGFF